MVDLRINLGSGQRPFQPPWINVDRQGRWQPDRIADARNMPCFYDDSAEMIVLHHVLEHFGCGEADEMLVECRRILAPGGSLLVFVPNMLELARMWQEGRVTDQVYMTNLYGAYMGDEADRHKWGYTPMTLMMLLSRLKYTPKVFNWRPIAGADIAGPDRWILGMEAIK